MNANEDPRIEVLARALHSHTMGVVAVKVLDAMPPSAEWTFDGRHIDLAWLQPRERLGHDSTGNIYIEWPTDSLGMMTDYIKVRPGDVLVRDPVSGRPKVKTAESEEA